MAKRSKTTRQFYIVTFTDQRGMAQYIPLVGHADAIDLRDLLRDQGHDDAIVTHYYGRKE